MAALRLALSGSTQLVVGDGDTAPLRLPTPPEGRRRVPRRVAPTPARRSRGAPSSGAPRGRSGCTAGGAAGCADTGRRTRARRPPRSSSRSAASASTAVHSRPKKTSWVSSAVVRSLARWASAPRADRRCRWRIAAARRPTRVGSSRGSRRAPASPASGRPRQAPPRGPHTHPRSAWCALPRRRAGASTPASPLPLTSGERSHSAASASGSERAPAGSPRADPIHSELGPGADLLGCRRRGTIAKYSEKVRASP